MKKCMLDIHPKKLVLVPDGSDGLCTPFLDLKIVIKEGSVSTSIFDKRDSFDFPIVSFPTLPVIFHNAVIMVFSLVN